MHLVNYAAVRSSCLSFAPAACRTSVVIDFAGQLKSLEAVALAYSDISVTGDVEEAAKGLFRALRWAEGRPSAQRLLIVGAYNGTKIPWTVR